MRLVKVSNLTRISDREIDDNDMMLVTDVSASSQKQSKYITIGQLKNVFSIDKEISVQSDQTTGNHIGQIIVGDTVTDLYTGSVVTIDQHQELSDDVDVLTTSTTELQTRVNNLYTRLDDLTRAVDGITNLVNRLSSRLEQLSDSIDSLVSRCDDFDERVTELENQSPIFSTESGEDIISSEGEDEIIGLE